MTDIPMAGPETYELIAQLEKELGVKGPAAVLRALVTKCRDAAQDRRPHTVYLLPVVDEALIRHSREQNVDPGAIIAEAVAAYLGIK